MAKSNPAPIKPPAWLQYLNLDYLLRSGVAPAEVELILRRQFRYVTAPSLEPNRSKEAFVTAELYTQGSEAELDEKIAIFLEPTSPGYGSYLGLKVRSSFGDASEPLFFHPLKVYSLAIVVDLAIYPPLREAVLAREPASGFLDTLPVVREQTYRDLIAQETLSYWLPGEKTGVAAALMYEFTIHDNAGYYGSRYIPSFQQHPVLDLRPRLPGKRAILSKNEQRELRFSPLDAQVMRLCYPKHSGRKGFEATGNNAGSILHFLRDRYLWLEKDPEPVTFSRQPVLLRLEQTTLKRRQIGQRNTLTSDPTYLRSGSRSHDYEDPSLEEEVSALEARWFTLDGSLDVSSADAVLVAGVHSYLWVGDRKTFFPISDRVDIEVAWRYYLRPSVELPPGYAPSLYRSLREGLHGTAIALPEPTQMGLSPAETPDFFVRVDGDPLNFTLSLEARYSFGSFRAFPGPEDEAIAGTRDLNLEAAAIERVAELGLAQDAAKKLFFNLDEDAAIAFWREGIIELRSDRQPPLTILLAGKLQKTQLRSPLKGQVRVSLVDNWFESDLSISTADVEVDLPRILQALDGKKRWIVLGDGSLSELSPELRELLQDHLERAEEKAKRKGSAPTELKTKLPLHQLGKVSDWQDSASVEVEIDPAVDVLRDRLRNALVAGEGAIACEKPQYLKAELRPYQEQGLAWLEFLHELPAGGILADDMGLGKTLMTLALLAWDLGKQEGERGISLVVCPTSVKGNWVREAEKFTPHLQTRILDEKEREQLRNDPHRWQLEDVDLFVTSYALLRRDCEWLAQIPFNYIILDEAQYIKNYDTATAKAARSLPAKYRLALSGTPVENRLGELYSLMEFCNPGILGTRKQFARRFETPILANRSGTAARRLRAIVRPFLLRRTKKQVLQELPPKQEIEYRCELSGEQRRLYNGLAAIVRGDMEDLLASEGLAKNQIKILTALLRLRQMACDPRLVDRSVAPSASSKRNAFLELISELVAEGRRVLVFSQFVELLKLWRWDLEREGIACDYLDGSTKDRDRVVADFQNGDSPVFLISLKAGGTGLNLTAADTVIHCDPWWNPAVEDQATDRAYRIGQEKHVTVYRLITAGTVEEKILQLKARKREIAEAIVSDSEQALSALSEEDVKLLLGDAVGAIDGDVIGETEEKTEASAPAKDAIAEMELAQELGPSLVAKIEGEALEQLVELMREWLNKTGKRQKDLAKLLGIGAWKVGDLLRGKARSLPRQEAERMEAILRDRS